MTPATGRMSTVFDLYKSLISSPQVLRASFFGASLEVVYSNLSVPRSRFSTSSRTVRVPSGSENFTYFDGAPTAVDSAVKYTARCEDGFWEVVFLQDLERGKFIEVWERGVRTGEIEVGDAHGEWFFEVSLGLPSFSPDGSKLVYLANPPPKPGTETDYMPSFGETYRAVTSPVIIGLDLKNRAIIPVLQSPVQSGDEQAYMVSPSVLSWHEDRVKMVTTGWRRLADGSQLGMVGCTNRPSSIYLIDIDLSTGTTVVSTVSPKGASARSPRVSKTSGRVVYLANKETAPHDSCAQLHILDVTSGSQRILVDEVSHPTARGGFPGIYTHQLPFQWLLDLGGREHMLLTSAWGCRQTTLIVDLDVGSVTDLARLTPVGEERDPRASWEMLCTDGGTRALVAVSTPKMPRTLVSLDFKFRGSIEVESMEIVERPCITENVQKSLSGLDFSVVPIPAHDPMEMLVISPCPIAELKEKKPPIIIMPHGGPHGQDSTVFSTLSAAYALGGYTVVQPNYAGSTGYGQEYVNRLLPPALSVLEVETTMAVIPVLKDMGLDWSPGKRFFVGASHGGYIGAWVSGRHPDALDAVVLRNPTTHYPSMIHSTDIPDIITASSGVAYPYDDPPVTQSPENYAKAYACSPVSVVGRARAPTLLLVGAEDGRVSPEQGRMWYHGLRKNGIKAEMKIYRGERHTLNLTVPAILGVYTETMRWLDKYSENK